MGMPTMIGNACCARIAGVQLHGCTRIELWRAGHRESRTETIGRILLVRENRRRLTLGAVDGRPDGAKREARCLEEEPVVQNLCNV
jgi:hypothetical protein